MQMKTLHMAVAGALLLTAGAVQAGGGGNISSSRQSLVCDQPLSRGQSTSCVLQSPDAAPQRVTVIGEPLAPSDSRSGVISRSEGPAVTAPNSGDSRSAPSSGAVSGDVISESAGPVYVFV